MFGKLLKGKKLSKLSPNKTYSGMFGSYIMSTFITYLFLRNIINLNELIIYTLIISTISQIVDLLISFLKEKRYQGYRKYFTWSWRCIRSFRWFIVSYTYRFNF